MSCTEAETPDVNRSFEDARAWMIDWITTHAWKIASPRQLTSEMCAHLCDAGVALETFNAFILMLHPQYFGVVHRWQASTGEVTTAMGTNQMLESDLVRLSPIQDIRDGAWGFRWPIGRAGRHPSYPVINEYADDGATDYVAMRLPFQDGSPQTITFTTKREDGFTTAELCLVDSLLFYMARMTEVQSNNYLSRVLLDTYVGHRTGAEILNGSITRGSGKTIRAVILMTDLHDFTAVSERLSGEHLIAYLNRYFDLVGKPILEHGGEILKFIGDAVLAIFPITDQTPVGPQCRAAHDAVTQALADAATMAEPLPFGAALHVGEVIYGNIGTEGRLDFTVIGPAVNLTARLESLTRVLNVPLVVSKAYRESAEIALVSRGHHDLKGIAEPVEVFATS